jgi:N-methylhydantoinase B
MTARGMERYLFRPWGRNGGSAGSLGRTILNPGTSKERDLGKIDVLQLNPGDIVEIITPSGGGYGDPLDRDPQLVLRDLQDGYVTLKEAENTYGVMIADGQVDESGTQSKRSQLSRTRTSNSAFSLGPERESYEIKLPEPLQDELCEVLAEFPIRQRNYLRRRMWEELNRDENTNAEWNRESLRVLIKKMQQHVGIDALM